MLSHSAGIFFMLTHSKNRLGTSEIEEQNYLKSNKEIKMETNSEEKKSEKNLGGRPKKNIRKEKLIAFKCTLMERKLIEANAKKFFLPLSEYIRQMALKGIILPKIKSLPVEVLAFTATLNHIAANINQVAKKRNSFEELSVLERAGLQILAGEIKKLVAEIRNYLRG